MTPQQPNTPFSTTEQHQTPDTNSNQESTAIIQAINLLYPLVPTEIRNPNGPFVTGASSGPEYPMGKHVGRVGSLLAGRKMGRGRAAKSQEGGGQGSGSQVSDTVVKGEMADAMDVGEQKGKGKPEYIFLYDKLSDFDFLQQCLNVEKAPSLFEAFLDGYGVEQGGDGNRAVTRSGCKLGGLVFKILGHEEFARQIWAWYDARRLRGVTMQVMMDKRDCGLRGWDEELKVEEDGELENMGVAVDAAVYV